MEKKIGVNQSSGAEKVENIEKRVKKSASAQKSAKTENAKAPKPEKAKAPKTGKTRASKPVSSKQTAKRTSKRSEKTGEPTPSEKRRQDAHERAVKREKRAAAKRAEAAKARAKKKEEKRAKKLSLKEKKLEKKSNLKEKKLEKKRILSEKKAERRQRRADKKAAYREKKAERRAQKSARREMLKHENKAEKEKRLAREKRELLAAKRQKRDARERAQEQKRKSREAAHARKAEDRKHRREQHTARKENRRGFGGWLAAVISLGVSCLTLATVVTAGAFRLNQMQIASESGYRATLYEMVSVSDDMENDLGKLRVSSGVDEQRRLLTDLLVGSAVMESALQKLPVDEATGTDISAFVNRTGDFARDMLARLASGKTLTPENKETIAGLYDVNTTLSGELNTLATTMTEKDLRAFIGGKEGTMSEKFGSMGEGTKVISDAPFAGEGNVGENSLSKEEEISSARAEELAKAYFESYHIEKITSSGETSAPDMNCYNFILTDENGAEYFAEITKRGGKLAYFATYEECKDKNFDLPSCDAIAKEYLAKMGIKDVEAVWLSDGGMVANLTYVSVQSGVRIYPEILRIRVCEEKGRVIGLDARGYLVNKKERKLDLQIGEGEAESLLSEELEVRACNPALIPVNGEETLCYEFDCLYGDEEFLVYLDATTGAETELLRVRRSARGSYLE